jgi:preprotein translocase subunit YajC
LWISPAYAQAAGGPGGLNDLLIQTVVPFGLIFLILYFLVLRPQQQRARDQQEMVKNVRRGDSVVTSGGIIGKVTRANDDNEIELEIAPNVKVRCQRQMIAEVRSKGEPVKE